MIVEVSVYLVSKRILKSHVQAAAKRRHLSVNELTLAYLIGDAAAARTSPSEIAVSFLSAADSSSSVA